jgi:predicted amidophosphoribosyltransferase
VPPTVLLLDDVYTTGATVDAAAAALRLGGASLVHVVSFARTVRYAQGKDRPPPGRQR